MAAPEARCLSARELAHDVLDRAPGRGQPPTRHLDELLPKSGLSPAERGHATELVHGVIRREHTLDMLLRQHVRRPLRQVESGALNWLRLATWELLFSHTAPPYAILNETAEAVKRSGNPQWTGFINGVLRAISRDLTPDFTDQPGPSAVPCETGRYRLLNSPVFPDPASDPRGYFRDAFSYPDWLIERWVTRFSRETLWQIGFWFNAAPIPTLRVNTLLSTRESLLEKLTAAGFEALAGRHPHAIHLTRTARIAELPGFEEGLFAVQDESAMEAATLLAPTGEERILDLCAAPGGKTMHMAALLQNRGQIVAVDVDPHRLKLIEDSSRRLHVTNVKCELVPRDSARLPKGPFDAVLLDVPCSNTGVLGKRPEVRWRLTPADLTELAEIQSRLLQAALGAVRIGGRVLYSTCSVEPEENEQLVRSVMEDYPGFEIVAERKHVPSQPADGGYQALLRSTSGGPVGVET